MAIKTILILFLLAILVVAALTVRISHPSPGVTAISLPGRCVLVYQDRPAQRLAQLNAYCPGQGFQGGKSYQLWPLKIESPFKDWADQFESPFR